MKTRFLTASHSLNNFGNSSVIHSTESFYNFSSFQDSHSVNSLQSYTGSHYSIPSTNLVYMTSLPKTYKMFPKTKFIYIEFAEINQDSQDTHFKLVSFKILQQSNKSYPDLFGYISTSGYWFNLLIPRCKIICKLNIFNQRGKC